MKQTSIRLTERILRYGISGCTVAALFSLAVVALVHLLPAIGPVGASMVVFCLIQPIGYVVHRMISYPDTCLEPDKKAKSRLRFVTTNPGGFIITIGSMLLVTDVFHESYLWGIALNWALIPGISFVIYLYCVFNVRSWSKREIA